MREAFVFGMLDKFRPRLLQQAELCPPDKQTAIPEGFNNHILWQLGHVLTVTDAIAFGLAGEASALPASYKPLFGNGSKPREWPDEVPAWDTIIRQLREQQESIKATFAGKLDRAVNENFQKAETAGELLLAGIAHETNHLGTINAMMKLLR